MKALIILLALGTVLAGFDAIARNPPGSRPTDITLKNMQLPPYNRWAFSHMSEMVPTVSIRRDADHVRSLTGPAMDPADVTVVFEGKEQSLDSILQADMVDAYLVMKDGEVLIEGYFGEMREDRTHLMMSMTKSITALTASVLQREGKLDFQKTVAYYLPEMKNSGWGRDTVRTLLDMKDGSAFTETYGEPGSPGEAHECASAWRGSDECPATGPKNNYEYLPTVGRNEDTYGTFHYKSATTDVVAWVLERASGQPLAELFSRHIWQPMGAEFDAEITVDKGGFVMASGGMNATLRDMGRLGQMVLDGGRVGAKQVVPESFISDLMNRSKEPTWPYPIGEGWYGENPYYRSFFWGVGNGNGDIEMVGVNGQLLRIIPKANMVIAQFASWPGYEDDGPDFGWTQSDNLMEALVEKYMD